MSTAKNLEAVAETIRETVHRLLESTTADMMDLEPLREAADEIDEIACKLRH